VVAHLDRERVHAETIPEVAAPRPAMTVRAAAASGNYPLIAGPITTGVVLGSFSQAVIIGLDSGPGPWALSLLGPLAARVPNGVLLGGGMADPGTHRPGDRVTIGGGEIAIGGRRISVVRRWNSRVFRVAPGEAEVLALTSAAAASVRGVPLSAITALERGLLAGDAAPAIRALVGLGDGLTPGGDDVLAGVLTGLQATGGLPDLAAQVGKLVLDRVLGRTSVLSAELLRLAAAGHACVEALGVLRAVHTGHQIPDALHRLLSIGHTSGADLATGLGMGLEMGLRCGRNMSRYGTASTTTR
jgi:hypothetical protein